MWNWLCNLLTGRKPPQAQSHAVRSAPPAPTHRAAAAAPAGNLDGAFLSWLLDTPPPCDAPLRDAEQTALAALDAVIASQRSAAELLPRAPAVIPQLLSALRQSDPSLSALVDRVSKDLQLVAEVMRMARSAHYRAQGEVTDLARAITTLGEAGLHSAIARVVLRPLFEAGGGALSARAAPRLWEHSEHKSRHCSTLAAAAGMDPFDGCLAGLMHNAGWTVALRTLDRGDPLPLPWTTAFVAQLGKRRDPLFGKVVGAWHVSAAVTALAAEAATPGLEQARSGLARPLLDSDREAVLDVLIPAGVDATAPSAAQDLAEMVD